MTLNMVKSRSLVVDLSDADLPPCVSPGDKYTWKPQVATIYFSPRLGWMMLLRGPRLTSTGKLHKTLEGRSMRPIDMADDNDLRVLRLIPLEGLLDLVTATVQEKTQELALVRSNSGTLITLRGQS